MTDPITTYVDQHGCLWDVVRLTFGDVWLVRRGVTGWEGAKKAIEMLHGPLDPYEPELN